MSAEFKFELTSLKKVAIDKIGDRYVGQLESMQWRELLVFAGFIRDLAIAFDCKVERDLFAFHKTEESHLEFGVCLLFQHEGKLNVETSILSIVQYVLRDGLRAFESNSLDDFVTSTESVNEVVKTFLDNMMGKSIKFPMDCKIGNNTLKVIGMFRKPTRKLQNPLISVVLRGVVVGADDLKRTAKIKELSDDAVLLVHYDPNFQHSSVGNAFVNRGLCEFKIDQRENEKGRIVSELISLINI